MITQEQFIKSNGCKKKIWLLKNKPEELKENQVNVMAVSAADEVFDAARACFPEGIDAKNADFSTVKKLLRKHKVIFNGRFESGFGSAVCDVVKFNQGSLSLYKVRCGSGLERAVKTALFQRAVLMSLGYSVSGVYLMTVNPDYVRNRRLDYKKLFQFTDITNYDTSGNVSSKIKFINSVNGKNNEPETKLNKFCSNCEFFEYCFKNLPENNIFKLGNLPFEVKITLFNHGILTYDDYMKLPEVSENCKVQIEAESKEKDIVDQKGIKEFLSKLKYPLGFLDFEAISPSVPRYRGTKPNERILTQFSYHYVEEEGGILKHSEFIGDGIHYPEKDLAEKLIEYIGDAKCILMYSPYERNCINGLIAKFPEYKSQLLKIRENLVDLEKPFSNKVLYKKEMKGKSSIKYVLPALYPDSEELDYKKMRVSDGAMAALSYMGLKNLDKTERYNMKKDLLEYCNLDTLAMVKLLESLKNAMEE